MEIQDLEGATERVAISSQAANFNNQSFIPEAELRHIAKGFRRLTSRAEESHNQNLKKYYIP